MQNLKKITISSQSTIQEALKCLGHYDGLRMLIVEENGTFVGILTDQDIRKGLLQNLSTSDSIKSVINTTPITAHYKSSSEELLALASRFNIYEIPLLDDHQQVIKVASVSKILHSNKYTNPIVIMAGGLGQRLRPLTESTPKPMLKVGNKPILQIILERFKNQGFTNIILCVNYQSHIIEEYFGDGSKFNLDITYVKEAKRMGTAGALSLLKRGEINEDFFVMNGDILTEVNFAEMLSFHTRNQSYATMGIRSYDLQIPYGVVKTQDNQILSIEEKPTLSYDVSAGIYIFNPKILDLIPQNQFFDMPNLFEEVLNNPSYNAHSYPITDYWIDIGRHEEYSRANQEILRS